MTDPVLGIQTQLPATLAERKAAIAERQAAYLNETAGRAGEARSWVHEGDGHLDTTVIGSVSDEVFAADPDWRELRPSETAAIGGPNHERRSG